MFDLTTILLLIAAPVAMAALGALWFRKDTEAENRKRAAIKVSGLLTSMGLTRLPKILDCYAVNDWSGLSHEIVAFAELALDPKAVIAEFDATFSRVLEMKLATAEGRALISAKLAEKPTA